MLANLRTGNWKPSLKQKAEAELELRRRRRARENERLAQTATTRYDPSAYLSDVLGWSPWSGSATAPGQRQIIDAYVSALRQQHEREEFENGEIGETNLQFWKPGMTIKNRIRIEAGHTVGKTKLASGLVNHFFDHFAPAIIYTYAPTWEQVKRLLWKEISSDRSGKDLPGRVLENCEIRLAPDYFALGRATNNAYGRGTERVQGQHGKYLMFVLDEAEGVADFVYDAVDSMTSGGISIVLMLANPRTRTSRFHKLKDSSNVVNFRMSCLNHPNVREGREIVPGAVRRQYVEDMLEKHCEVVAAHDADSHTFELDFGAQVKSDFYPGGTIFRPNAEFMFRVLGIAPANLSDDTFVPVGRYEAAKARRPDPLPSEKVWARLGVDVARFGLDAGTLYTRHGGAVHRAAQLDQLDTNHYAGAIITEAKRLAALGVKSLHVRIDGGGGFGGGVVDRIKDDPTLKKLFRDYKVFEIHFNGTPYDGDAYYDSITEMMAEAAESLKGVVLRNSPEKLETDLCERKYKWTNRSGVSVKKLESKDDFKKRAGHSPDDGDGFCLAIAPDYLFDGFDRDDDDSASYQTY